MEDYSLCSTVLKTICGQHENQYLRQYSRNLLYQQCENFLKVHALQKKNLRVISLQLSTKVRDVLNISMFQERIICKSCSIKLYVRLEEHIFTLRDNSKPETEH
jgi:hypothetical protein